MFSIYPTWLHTGCHHTWRSNSETGHRLDCIAIPVEWTVGSVSSQVWTCFEHVHAVDDRQPVLLQCQLTSRFAPWRPSVKRKTFRPGSDTDPDQLQCFRYLAAALPPVDWFLGVDSHYALFVQSTLWCWSTCVSQPSFRRVKLFLFETTMDALTLRAPSK